MFKEVFRLNIYPNLEQAKQYTNYKNLPISCTIPTTKTAIEICKILKNVSANVFVLESCEDSKNWGRYSFLGYEPTLAISCKDNKGSLSLSDNFSFEGSPHAHIRKVIDDNKSPIVEGLPTFTGGLVGYFSYEFIKYSEPKLNIGATDEENFNDVDLMLFDKIIAIDNLENKIILIANIKTDNLDENFAQGVETLKSMQTLVETGSPLEEASGRLLEPLQPAFDKDSFCSMIDKAKRYIFEGDIFQVVLSNRLSARYEGSMFNVYQNLRSINPSPYMFYFCSDEIEIAGASPETLVKLDNSTVTTFPLAGTKPRGKTPEEDLQFERDLLSDPKECAEHNMLVDLGRNDIGKISKFGSVTVEKYMQIERFSHVMHIGSTVSGTIREDKDYLDAIDSVLPAGTLSGAPKIRACEIINELENLKRGIYGGAIGYIDFTGNMDTCIAIRLAFKKNGKVFVRAGAGIVADSVGESEYTECINKAKAVVNALTHDSNDSNESEG